MMFTQASDYQSTTKEADQAKNLSQLAVFEALEARQIALEEEMQGLGIARYRTKLQQVREQGNESATSYGKLLMRDYLEAVQSNLTSKIEGTKTGKGGKRSVTVGFLDGLDAYVCSFCALRVCIDTLSSQQDAPPRFFAMSIARAIEEQCRLAFYEGEAKPMFRQIIKEVVDVRRQGPSRVKAALKQRFTAKGIDFEPWPIARRLAIGMILFEIICEVTGFLEVVTHKTKTRVTLSVLPTEKVSKWIHEMVERCELMAPEFLPMVFPPKEWTGCYGGGYLSPYIRKLSLVKSRKAAKGYLEELSLKINDGQLDRVLGAVNAIQGTAWKINLDVLGVFKELWTQAADCHVLAMKSDIPHPTKPLDITTNQDARREWAKANNPVRKANAKSRSKRMLISKILWLAKKFETDERIYFPHQLDFRGRMYPVTAFLHPQGTDLAKSLLTFAEGKAINDSLSADWLAIHGANLYGIDKVGFPERIQWVEDNLEMILSSAMQPKDDLRWQQADKPWQFLAFCVEYQKFLEEGFGFISHLPVALDGSCNGIQHFSAMLLDPVGGKAVNLIPSDKPQDIYQEVCDVAIEKLKASNSPYAQLWVTFGINRKTTKRSVMVLPYGGTKHSCVDFVIEWFEECKEAGKVSPFDRDTQMIACCFLAGLVWESISEVVICARSAMSWLQQVAKKVSTYGLPINWTAPSGFPVRQAYQQTIATKVDFIVFGKRHSAILATEIGKIDCKRQKNGISPNFVHSLDASAMVLTVNRMAGNGVTSFAMIHDSYATHAADTQLLGAVLRNTFYRMYSDTDVLENFRKEVGVYVDESLPETPVRGTLDLREIEKSDFFFA